MSWFLLCGLAAALGMSFLLALARRIELARMERTLAARERAVRHGHARAELQQPVVDLSRCLGCGTCVAACPEENVLELVHGQAVVVNGARCKGYAECARECPVGAITVTLADLADRRDVPALDDELEAIGTPNLFLAGEVTAHTLVKTAIDQGAAVGAEVARRVKSERATRETGVLDLCVVGAGPAGLSCSLEAKRHGLDFVTLDQAEGPGGTVAKYPRRKLIVSQPIVMPLHGRLPKTEYTKEELIDVWLGLARDHELPLRGGVVVEGIERGADGPFTVRTKDASYRARHVCLALGRRGVPMKLGVPGEELAKVSYSLLDAHSYTGRRILVVGGGDSAVEAAMGLAEQTGNEVVLSYRKESFFRIRTRNEKRLAECLERGALRVLYRSELRAIREDEVELVVRDESGERALKLPNDDVFVMAGGTPPLALLEGAGVSFDPALRPATPPVEEQGPGLVQALGIGFGLTLLALGYALFNADYYALPAPLRPEHAKHLALRPGLGTGLALGIASTLLVAVNLLYLVRRSPRMRLAFGSLRAWMTSHVATGVLAFLCATLHAGLAPRQTVGGHAYWALAALLVTGAIGRYFYAWVPRAANGRELELAEVKARLARETEAWSPGQRRFGERAQREIAELTAARQWRGSFFGRVLALLGLEHDLRRTCARLALSGRAQGIPEERVRETLALARRAHRAALMAAHYEDLRAVLAAWRYLHRWIAALLVLLVALHVANALLYGAHYFGGAEGVAP